MLTTSSFGAKIQQISTAWQCNCELGIDLEQEDDANGFLRVTLEHDPETDLLEMKQTRRIHQSTRIG
jgi:hypothetical protein